MRYEVIKGQRFNVGGKLLERREHNSNENLIHAACSHPVDLVNQSIKM